MFDASGAGDIAMKNIERFNVYTAHIFGVLYNEFPVPRMMHAREVVTAVRASLELSPDEEAKQNKFVNHTLRWLQETGYIKAYGTDENRTFVLEPRAFEAMAAPLPSALRGGDLAVQSVGEKLVDVAGDLGREVGKETRKEVAAQLVGQVIGHAMKVFTGP
jgi:hypothetical protein